MTPEKLRVAMVVIDANDYTGSSLVNRSMPSPVVHNAIQGVLEGMRDRQDVECYVIYGSRLLKSISERIDGAIHYIVIPYRPVPLLRMGGAYLGRVAAIYRFIRKLRPHIVHGQGTEAECGLVARYSGFPNVVTLHGNMRLIQDVLKSPAFSYPWIASKMEDHIVSSVDGVVCLSKYSENHVRSHAKATWCVINPVAADFFDVANQPEPEPTFLCVGDVGPRKNQNGLIEALDQCGPDPGCKLVFAGFIDPEAAYVQRFLDYVNTRSWIRYEGVVDQPKLQSLLAGAYGLVLPSIEDNCPMVVLEAQAAGVPVLASRVGGVPELVVDGETGILFDPKAPESIRLAFATLLGSRQLRDKFAQAGRHNAHATSHPKMVAQKHMDIYRSIAGMESPAA